MKYIFIARKPESSDYCRGCLMERYLSDFIFKENLEEADLVQEWAQVLHRNKNLRINEVGYAIQVLVGKCLYEGDFQSSSEDSFHGYYHSTDEDETTEGKTLADWLNIDRLQELQTAAETEAQALDVAQKAAEAKEEESKRLREEAEQRDKRKAEFEKLKSEFEKS